MRLFIDLIIVLLVTLVIVATVLALLVSISIVSDSGIVSDYISAKTSAIEKEKSPFNDY